MVCAAGDEDRLRGPGHRLNTVWASESSQWLDLRCRSSGSLHGRGLTSVGVGLRGPSFWVHFPEADTALSILDDLRTRSELLESDGVLRKARVAAVHFFTHLLLSTCNDLDAFLVGAKLRDD